MNWLPRHPGRQERESDFQRKSLEHPTLPPISGKAELTGLFSLDAQSLAGRGAAETACPHGVSRCLWHPGRAAWWILPQWPALHFLLCTVPSGGGVNGVIQSSAVSEQRFSPALKALYNEGCHLCPETQSPIAAFFQTIGECRKTSI